MTNDNRQSGLRLCLAGIAGVFFFWLTDPRWGFVGRRIAADELIDAINQGRPGTLIGLTGSAIVLVIGVWLMTRRTA